MKKIFLFWFFGVMALGVRAQVPYDTVTVVDPQNFTLATTIDTALVQVISRKANANRRINFQTIKNYSTPDITLSWLGIDIEDTTGTSATYRDFFVTDNEGEVWFVDNAGSARKLYDPAQFQAVTISNDTLYISDGNFAIIPGIASAQIDSVSYYGDTLRIYEGGDTIPFKAEILGGLTDGDYGDIDVSSSGAVMNIDTAVVGPIELASTAVTPGSYTNAGITVDADGRITAASSGAAIDSSIYELLPLGDVEVDANTNDLDIINMGQFYVAANIVGMEIAGAFYVESSGEAAFGGSVSATVSSTNRVNLEADTLDATLVTTFLGFPGGTDTDNQTLDTFTIVSNILRASLEDDGEPFQSVDLSPYLDDTDNQTIDTFSRSGSTISLSLEDDGEPAVQLNLSIFLQTLGWTRDTISISGSGTQFRSPGPGFLRDSITGAALTIDLKQYNQAVVEIRMETCTSTTLTINNPWSATDIDATYPTFEGETGVYSFHFLGISGTDNITWPADFLDMNGTALGTDALTTGTMYTCYRNPVSAKYYCK